MGSGAKHWVAGSAAVAVAAGVNVTTGMFTQRWAVAWFAATVVLVVVGGGLDVWLGRRDGPSVTQRVTRTKVSGDIRQRLSNVGDQSVADSEVGGGLDQSQDSGHHDT